jgi:hypothetical protein
VGQQQALTLTRIYPKPGEGRARCINYKHVIRSLAAKPQAFRYSQLRDDLLPNDTYQQIWKYADKYLATRESCKWIVTVLRLAFEYDIEQELGEDLLKDAKAGHFDSIIDLQARFLTGNQQTFNATPQHDLVSYDELLSTMKNSTTEKTNVESEVLF